MKELRVVVIGYGMAAARLAEEIRRIDPDGRRVALTIVGAELEPAYNRILLTGVLTGRLRAEAIRLQDKAWLADHRIELQLGVAACAVDRSARAVQLTNGERIRYDVLVFATGSRPRIPPTPGLRGSSGEFAPGVVAFRTLADCDRLREQVRPDTSVVVLGGGVLGLELARALLTTAGKVTVVHPAAWVMERQLDQAAGGILATVLERMGIRFRVGRSAVRHEPGVGVWLDDGSLVPAGVVAVAAGAIPETTVAERAGVHVEAGIVVDERLRTNDPRVFAIGDCARAGDQPQGFVEPAWDQARVLAELVTNPDSAARYTGCRTVTTLKAPGTSVMSLGDAHVSLHDPGAEVLCLTDPTGGRYAKLVLRDNVVAGAILLGLPAAAAATTQYYLNGTAVPADRLELLVGNSAGRIDEPSESDGSVRRQLVCVCNGVTREALTAAWHRGARSVEELAVATRATTGCGCCTAAVAAVARQPGPASTETG